MSYVGNTNTTQAFTPAIDYFSGNASTTAFTLSRPVASVAQVQVVVNNVAQNPSSAYTVSGNTITFTSAPSSGTNNIYVYYTSPITQVIAPSQGTVNTTSLGTITNIASGSSSLTLQTGASNTTAMTIDTSQNVGIGTTSPSKKLDVFNSGTTTTDFVVRNGTVSLLSFVDSGAGYTGTSTNHPLLFTTNNTERMRINSGAPILCLSGGNTSATGTGIAFPATQSASSDANTLDDYEEGTWSAVVAGESGTITSYIVNSATYTKTGDTVYVYLRFNVVNKGTGSNFVVSGLPFTASRELLGIWAETNTTGLTGFMFNAGTGATSFTSRLAANWGGACLVNGNYTVEVTYKV